MKDNKTKIINNKLNERKYFKESLLYPIDIDTDRFPNSILFNINVITGSQFDPDENSNVKAGDNSDVKIEQSGSTSIRHADTKMDRNSKRIATNIVMATPLALTNNESVTWNSNEFGSVGHFADVATNITDLTMSDVANAAKEGSRNMATGLLQQLTPLNAKDLSEFARGTIANPYMEVNFSGVTNRTFSFTFIFTPRSEKESDVVEKIIQQFRVHKAPESKYAEEGQGYWLYPSEFDITFLRNGTENKHVNKISTCALTEINVVYGTDDGKFVTSKKGASIKTTLTLAFMEMEIMTKERIMQGF